MEDELKPLTHTGAGWSEDEIGQALLWEGKYANFAEALAAVNMIGAIAEAHNHHPDIEFGWGYLRLKITTHETRGLTPKDFALADALKPILDK